MTIEEKLSAIKAINEEKDFIDEGIKALIARTAKESNDWRMFRVSVPHQVIKDMDAPLLQYFYLRRETLISKAEQLMK